MNHDPISIPLLVAGCGLLFFVGHAFELVFRRYRIPDVLLLILLGVLAGPVMGWIRPTGSSQVEHLFGHIALIVILFHGGLDLGLHELRANAAAATRLAMALLVLTTLMVALTAHWVLGQPWPVSCLLGLVLSPLAATVALCGLRGHPGVQPTHGGWGHRGHGQTSPFRGRPVPLNPSGWIRGRQRFRNA